MNVMKNPLALSRVLAVVLPAGFVVAALGTGIAIAGVEPADTATFRPAEAMHYVLGSKRAVGYFIGQKGECRVTMMIAEAVDPDAGISPSAARLRISMRPGQSANFGSAEGAEMTLTCGPDGDTVEVRRPGAVRS
jgi:hypothetical protein